MRSLWERLRWRDRRDSDLDAELRAHLALERQRRIGDGEDPDAAAAAARRDLGNVLMVKEATRQVWGWNRLEQLGQDLRYAARVLRRSPGFTVAAVLSLGLGAGANTAIFQLIDAVRLRALPVPAPEQLVEVQVQSEIQSGNRRGRNARITNAIWEQLKSRVTTADLFAWGDFPLNVSLTAEVRQVEGLWVSGSFFQALGIQPALGRFFTPADDRAGCGYPGVVISHSFWQSEYGGSPDVVNRGIPVGPNRTAPILGVAPAGFFGLEAGRRFDVALPICSNGAANLQNRMMWFLTVMGRVRAAQSMRQAEAELAAIAPGVFEATVPPYSAADQDRYRRARLRLADASTGLSQLREASRQPLDVLMVIVFLVLLIACCNVANMMLARAAAREHEFGVRASLGASRGRVARQLLTEGFLLACLGALAGFGIGRLLTSVLVSQISTSRDPIFLDVSVNWRILLFTLGIACVSTLLFAAAPSLLASGVRLSQRMAGRGLGVSRQRRRWQHALLTSQVAVCLVLLVTALLFVRSFRNLRSADLGFRADNLLVANTFFSEDRYPVEKRNVAYQTLAARLRAVPGVQDVSQSYVIPVSGSAMDLMTKAAAVEGDRMVHAFLSPVGPGYFRVMGQTVIAGRDFADTDTANAPGAMVINEEYARQAFGTGNPLGRKVQLQAKPGGGGPSAEVVGVVRNSVYGSVREKRRAIAYYPASQEPRPRTIVRYVIRTSVTPEALIQPVSAALTEFDPTLNFRFAALRTQIDESLVLDKLMATLAGFFGLLAASLAVIGLYGVVSYSVAQRRREFGVRMALGSQRWDIASLVLHDVSKWVALGLAVGGGIAYLAGSSVRTLIYGVDTQDPVTLLAASLLLAAAGILAALLPARRASAVPPTEALRG